MSDNRNTLTDEILVLAETLGDIKARFERVESEFAVQSKPLEAALAALSAAMTGIKTLQHHVLDNSLSALSLKVEEQRKAIDDQITVIVGELKGADAQNSEKIALQTAELKQQFAEICSSVQQLSSQFDAQIKRVEFEAKEQITKFAAVAGPQGPAGASLNPKGNWQEGVFYQRLDVVSLLGTSYVSNVDNNASKPNKNSENWTVLAARAANVGGGGAGNFASLAGIAEVSQGGTGITQYAIGDILYANDTGSLARLPAGVNGQFLKTTGSGSAPEWETPAGGGDVVGPASATDNALVRFDGTSGTAIQNSNATLTDAGALTLASNLTVSGTTMSLGGAASSWDLNAIQVLKGAIYGAGNETGYYNNANYSGGWKYTASAAASGYLQNGGIHQWYTAGSGTAGNAISFTQQMSLNNSGALSLAGNLTVSGTGTSSVAGNLQLGSGKQLLFGGTTASYPMLAPSNQTVTAQLADGSDWADFKAKGATLAGNLTVSGTGASSVAGNVLIGTTTDSGNGKLQLATHTSSAGGIGFGTDVSLYRSGNDQLTSYSSGTANNLFLRHSTTLSGGLQVQIDSSKDVYIFQRENRPMYIGTNNTTALTLDTSQNATFAGTAKFGKGGGNTAFSANGTTAESGIYTQANTGFVFFADNATATKGIKIDVNNGGLTVLSGGLTTAAAGGSAGTWKLGVYSATAPSATGYVTIDIGGTTYRLLAST